MSDDLIRRSDAIKAVENVSENYTKEGDREWHPHIDFITQALVQAPSADRPRGEWIEQHENGHGFWVGVCSQCGEENLVDNYCPNCGAKMKGADDE